MKPIPNPHSRLVQAGVKTLGSGLNGVRQQTSAAKGLVNPYARQNASRKFSK